MTYYTYLLLRVIFGICAAIILQTTQIFEHSLLLALAAVMTAVTTLESFTFKIAGQEIADLSSLFDSYRKKMINDELNEAGQRKIAQEMQLVGDLVNECGVASLEKSCLMCLRARHQEDPKPNQLVNKKIDEIKQIAGSDEETLKMLYASEIVNINPEYARLLLEKQTNKGNVARKKEKETN